MMMSTVEQNRLCRQSPALHTGDRGWGIFHWRIFIEDQWDLAVCLPS